MALIEPGSRPWREPPGHDRGFSRYLVSPGDGLSTRLDFRLSRYPVGGRVQLHMHNIAEQLYYFIEGTATVVCGEEIYEVEPEQTVFVPPRVPHSVVNTGDRDLVFVVVSSPPEDILQ